MGASGNYSYYYSKMASANNSNKTAVPNLPEASEKRDSFFKQNKKTIIGVGTAILAFGALILTSKNKIFSQKTQKNTEILKDVVFDLDYKKKLLSKMGIDPSCVDKLKSLVGKEEFLSVLNKVQKSPQAFSVGDEFSNVKNKIFNFNLHIHTTNSDGQMSVEKLLDQASRYADKFAEKNNAPFYIGITDHDTVNGCIEALHLLVKNPEKYKNLKVILGTETKALFDSKFSSSPKEVHLLSYCLNPFDQTIAGLSKDQMNQLQSGARKAIIKANSLYSKVESRYNYAYSFDDFKKIRSSVLTSPCDIKYSMKDYMQFRLIYADIVENNQQLVEYLSKNGISLSELDFSVPKFNITKQKEGVPYWQNYVDETNNYLLNQLKTKNPNGDYSDLQNVFKQVSGRTKDALESMEKSAFDFNAGILVKVPEALSFEKVLKAYSDMDGGVCGIAHPCILHSQEQNNPQVQELMEDLFATFKNRLQSKPVIYEGYYQGYWPGTNSEWIGLSDSLGSQYGYLKTGGLDSHFNNIFTDQKNLSEEFINQIIS